MNARNRVSSAGSVLDDLEKRQLLAELQERMFRRRERVELGRYVLLQRLGSGAMGVVYRAEDPALRREIAIKVLHPARTDVERGHERLRREARALGQVRHPNVIEVYDVGHTEDRVFVAMELVEGQSLEAWLEASPRSWAAVIDVFVQAGRGLAAAHRAGIAHRDFKPSNVQVGQRVCVLDFGLARAVQSSTVTTPGDPRAAGIATKDGSVVGTPRYLAPAQLLGATADAAGDQYAFCVALWEALFGEPPFDPNDMLASKRSLERARLRPTSPVPLRIQRAIRRGLAPVAADRFASMDALLDALAPRRSRWAIAGASAIAASIVGAVTWWPEPVRLDVTALQRAWEVERTALSARAGYFRGRDLMQADRIPEALAVLEAAHREAVASGDDRTRVSIGIELASVEIQWKRDAVAGRWWVADVRSVLARVEPDARVLKALAELEVVVARVDGDAEAALVAAREAVRHARDGWGDGKHVANALYTLGVAAFEHQRFDEARTALEEAIAIAERKLGPQSLMRAHCLHVLAAVEATDIDRSEDSKVREERAVVTARRALAEFERVLGPDHHDAINARLSLGIVLADAGHANEARDELLSTIERWERSATPDPRGIAKALENLGTALAELGELEEAEAALQRAVIALAELHGEDYPPLGTTLTHLGRLQEQRGSIARARATYERAVALARTDGPGPLAIALEDLAALERSTGHNDRAATLYREAAQTWTEVMGADCPQAKEALARAEAVASP